MWLFEQGSGGGAILRHKKKTKKKQKHNPSQANKTAGATLGGGRTRSEESEKSESQSTLREFFFLYNNVGDHTGRRGAEMGRHMKRGECLKEVWRGNTWLLLVPEGERERETGPSWCGGGERREEKRGESKR